MRLALVRFWCGSRLPGVLIIRQPIAYTRSRLDSGLQRDRYERQIIDQLRWFCCVFVRFRLRSLCFGVVVSGAKRVRLVNVEQRATRVAFFDRSELRRSARVSVTVLANNLMRIAALLTRLSRKRKAA
jgi:hypothetical protein